jgi:DNA polymerase-1
VQRVQCIDIESALMADGLAAPAMVCMAWSDGQSEKLLVPWEGEDPYKRFESILRSGAQLVNQHVFFDLAILCNERPHLLPLVFEAIATGQIKCVKIREQLIRIAAGQAKFIDIADDEEADEDDDGEKMQKTRFDLAAIAKRWLGIDLAKTDTWRLSYEILRGIPVSRWPEDAVEYSVKDTRVALGVWAAQDKFIKDTFPDGVLPGEIEANQAAWALHLMKCWGVRTCPEAVAALTRDLQMKTLWTAIGLIMSGILRKGGTGAKPKAVETKSETQRRITIAFEARGENVPFTSPTSKFPEGQVKTAKKVLEDSGDKTLLALAEHKGFMKVLGTYIPKYVAKGIHYPITADWNALVESFRVSCSKPNLTNPPRVGEVRNCFKARDGYVYVSADFDQAELRSWAQVRLVMFGKCKMAEAFQRDLDPHLMLGAELLKISLEEAIERYALGDKDVDDKRQFSKEPNFGLIGGMGWRKFQERAALKGIILSDEEAQEIRSTWMKTWDAKPYLDYFSENHSDPNLLIHPVTGFYRGECGYTDAANHMIQHLTAIGAKQALIDLSAECYLDSKSVLYGARPVIFMHDEIFGEIREEVASEGAKRWGDVMRGGMEKWVKDVPTKCTPVLTRRLYKGAKPVYVDGVLVPSKPMIIDGKKKWVPDLLETSEMRRAA